MASGWYIAGLAGCLNGSIDLNTDDIRVLLVDDTYTFNEDTHVFVDDVSGDELAGVGYERKALGSEAVTAETGMAVFDAANVNWASIAAGETIGGIVVYKHVGADDSANPLICWVDTTNLATGGGAVDITWPAPASGGIAYIDNV
jgi:hypothetical protein